MGNIEMPADASNNTQSSEKFNNRAQARAERHAEIARVDDAIAQLSKQIQPAADGAWERMGVVSIAVAIKSLHRYRQRLVRRI